MSVPGGQSGGGALGVIGVVVFIGVIIKYFWWILAGLAMVLVVFLAVVIGKALIQQLEAAEAERKRQNRRLSAQADRQHRWVLDGDPRGVYGAKGAEYMRYVERNNWDGLLRSIQRPPVDL
ncbi:hypothetical protein MCHIJ_32960 [Mycolicibacterium chitae]|uniref:Uncharacterized protein n=1 Tax=Mycolicibacterium chitae TaxID=1792 RepID=A0A3S4RM35_MYCCI|nr:hypothetical protein [Mycolicibacterium chitae]BBZ03859.1 hypothetical protein MCHIJ_32960 [Mycolicibacterium chitae]VEG47510.1 Uncharacterised protein [Mycolicibacterium chitae]